MRDLALAVDLGSTHLRLAHVTPELELTQFERHALPELAGEELQTWVHDRIAEARENVHLTCVSAAGVINPDKTVTWKRAFANSIELWDWNVIANADVVVNDAAAAATAEARRGALVGARRGLGLTVGTGAGCALVIDGHVHATELNMLEISHPLLTATTSRLVSGRGLVAFAERIAEEENDGELRKACALGGERPPAFQVVELAANGSAAAQRAVCSVGESIGLFVAEIAPMLLIERVAVGGGMSDLDELLLTPARRILTEPQRSPMRAKLLKQVTIAKAVHGPDANLVGAALALDDLLHGRI